MLSLRLSVASATSLLLLALGVSASPNPFPNANPDPNPTPNAAPQIIPTPTATFKMNALISVGCFSTPAPMIDHGQWTFQSKGNCQGVCWGLNMPVMGVVNGTNCFCGDLMPPNSTMVKDSECNTPCSGIDTEMCGGANKWTVYLTGTTRNHIENLDPQAVSSSSKPSKTAEATVVVTAKPKSSSGGGTNTVGIVVGVIVGLVAIGAIAFGVFLFLRNKKRKEEEEYKKATDVQSFVNGGKSNDRPQMWAPDQRLDSAGVERRQSNGSIADNQDYSRRILQVRNPDGF